MRVFILCVVILAFTPPAIAGNQAISPLVSADECPVDTYSSPGDDSDSYPLTRPHTWLAMKIKAARKGNALEQRNLAVSYESGYLISKCVSKAAYWYRRAAKGGDEVAKAWVARRDVFDRLAAGPECAGSSCNIFTDDIPQFLSLTLDQGMRYLAPLTINGVTVTGHIDTGATSLVIDADTAIRMGISLDGARLGKAKIANGATVTTYITAVPAIRVGSITLDNVEVVVGQPGSSILIGMKVLNRLRMSAAGGQMALSK